MARQASHDEPIRLLGNPSRKELLAMLDEAVRAVQARPKSVMRHCNKTALLLGLGREEEALESANGAVRAGPDDADAHIVKGLALHSLGRREEALQSYERAIELDPARSDARNNMGGALLELGRYGEAVKELDRAIRGNYRHANAHVNRGRALHFLGRNAEAIRSLRRAVSIRNDDAGVWFDIGVLLFKTKSMAKSLGAFETAIKLRPGYARAHHARGIALQHLGRRDEADASFVRAHELDPALVAPSLPVEVDDIYVAWHEAREIRDRIESPTSPRDVMRHQIRSRVAEFLNASRRILEYHEKQYGSDIVKDYHRLETRAKKYLQYVNKAKHEYLPDVHIIMTGKRKRVYPSARTGQPMVIIEEGARLFYEGRKCDIDTWPDEMFVGDVGKGFTYEAQVCRVVLEDGEVELVEFMDAILGGVKELLENHGYDTSGLANAGPYYGLP
ncbi:MAG: tetratricopeptide repeat protein [Deltaproteobacteria bacterium]|nr:tetratricopeptide repeat protein [Deltaproteobacteria bacterium]